MYNCPVERSGKRQGLIPRIVEIFKRELAPLSDEERRIVQEGDRLFNDFYSGLITREDIPKRLADLDDIGVSSTKVLRQFSTMLAAQNSVITFRS